MPTSSSFAGILIILGLVVAGMAVHNLIRAAPQYEARGFTPARVIQLLALAVGLIMAASGSTIAYRAYLELLAAGPG